MTSKTKECNFLQESQIKQYFAGTTVFLTGGTGFLGKLILEKLFRTCKDIKRVYILIRAKKGSSVEKRFEEMLTNVLFDALKREQPQFTEKISLMIGDCVLPKLGLSKEDEEKLINEVNCVFHCAATVRFDEKIRLAAYINVRATRDLLELSKRMKQFKSFVHVSTAFSNCVFEKIEEDFYVPPIEGEKLLSLVETLDDDFLEKITPTLLGKWPNTYVFTKAIAEGVVKSEGKGLPIAVVRPSMITPTAEQPMAGWIDNVYGPIGMFLGVGVGLIHVLHCRYDYLADVVPADFVINCSIAAAWDVGTKKILCNEGVGNNNKDDQEKECETTSIYNYVSCNQQPINWRNYIRLLETNGRAMPTTLEIWYPFVVNTPSAFLFIIYAFFLHHLPAYIVDFFAYLFGKKPRLVKGYQKIDKFMNVISYFATKQWSFKDDNTKALWKKLNIEDQKSFNFNLSALNWSPYFVTFTKGARVHLLKDSLDTIPRGRFKYNVHAVVHYMVVGLLIFGFYTILMSLF